MADDDADTEAGTNAPDEDVGGTRSRGIGREPTPEELDRRQEEIGSVRKQAGPDLDGSRGLGRPADVPETDMPLPPPGD